MIAQRDHTDGLQHTGNHHPVRYAESSLKSRHEESWSNAVFLENNAAMSGSGVVQPYCVDLDQAASSAARANVNPLSDRESSSSSSDVEVDRTPAHSGADVIPSRLSRRT